MAEVVLFECCLVLRAPAVIGREAPRKCFVGRLWCLHLAEVGLDGFGFGVVVVVLWRMVRGGEEGRVRMGVVAARLRFFCFVGCRYGGGEDEW